MFPAWETEVGVNIQCRSVLDAYHMTPIPYSCILVPVWVVWLCCVYGGLCFIFKVNEGLFCTYRLDLVGTMPCGSWAHGLFVYGVASKDTVQCRSMLDAH